MANSHTALLGLVKQVTGENPDGLWGDTLNSGFMDLVEAAIAGRSDIDVSGGSVTLNDDVGTPNEARAMMLIVGGTPGVPRNVIVPTSEKFYIVSNEADDVVTVKTAIGVGVSLEVGQRLTVYVDQALDNVFQIGSVGASIAPAPAFSLPLQPGIILNSAPSSFPGLTESSQGSLTTINSPFGATAVTVNDTFFDWVKTDVVGGSPDGSQYSPAPASDFALPCWFLENGTLEDGWVNFQADGLRIRAFKCNGAWINGSSRQILAATGTPYATYSTV